MNERVDCDCKECVKAEQIQDLLMRLDKRDEANNRIISELYAKIAQLTDVVMSEHAAMRQQIAKITSAPAFTQASSNNNGGGGGLTQTYFLELDTKLARIETKLVQVLSGTDAKPARGATLRH